MAAATDLKSVDREVVRVRVPPSAFHLWVERETSAMRLMSLAFLFKILNPTFRHHIVQSLYTLPHIVDSTL